MNINSTTNKLQFDWPYPPRHNHFQFNQCSQAEYVKRLAADTSLQCACARIGSRSLSWLTWLGKLSRNPGSILDRINRELAHQHIFFEDIGTNIGFSQHGLFYDDPKKIPYHYDQDCYDSQVLRKSLSQVSDEGLGFFFILGNNCQRFVSRVLQKYRQNILATKP